MNRFFVAGLVVGLVAGIVLGSLILGNRDKSGASHTGTISSGLGGTVTSTITLTRTFTTTMTVRGNNTSSTPMTMSVLSPATVVVYPNGTRVYVYGKSSSIYNPVVTSIGENSGTSCEAVRQRYEKELSNLREELKATKLAMEARLENLREQLGREIALLNNSLARLAKGIEELDKWYGVFTSPSEEASFKQYLLVLAAHDPGVHGIVEEIRGRASDANSIVLHVFSWIMTSLGYYPDPLVHVITPSGLVTVSQQYWSLPNETLARRGGDCEDLALLVYAVLRNVLPGAKLYLLEVKTRERQGHVAVLIGTRDGYYLVDPAGDYLNGWSAALRLGNALVNPLSIDPDTKKTLLESGEAKLVYTSLFSTTSKPSIEPMDLRGLLLDWLEALGLSTNELRITLYTEHSHLEANGVDELVAELAQ